MRHGVDLIAGEYRKEFIEPISKEDAKAIREEGIFVRTDTKMVYGNDNLSITVDPTQVWEVTKEYPKSVMLKRNNVEFRISRHNFERCWNIVGKGE